MRFFLTENGEGGYEKFFSYAEVEDLGAAAEKIFHDGIEFQKSTLGQYCIRELPSDFDAEPIQPEQGHRHSYFFASDEDKAVMNASWKEFEEAYDSWAAKAISEVRAAYRVNACDRI